MKKLFIIALLLTASAAFAGSNVVSGTGPQFASISGQTVYNITFASQAGTAAMYVRDVTGTTMSGVGPVKLTITATAGSPVNLILGAAQSGPFSLVDGIKFTYGCLIEFMSNTGTAVISSR